MVNREQKIEDFRVGREMLSVQGESGNWDYDEYMHGLYNGMEFMLSLAEGREPTFREAPKKWKRATKFEKLKWKLKRIFNLSYGIESESNES